jgi:hypothetical protein
MWSARRASHSRGSIASKLRPRAGFILERYNHDVVDEKHVRHGPRGDSCPLERNEICRPFQDITLLNVGITAASAILPYSVLDVRLGARKEDS